MLEQLQNLNFVGSVVVLNDFFLDRIIKIDDITKLFDLILQKKFLGGSIRGIPQVDLKGGNATNVAFALARLGAPVSLITVANKTGSQILQDAFSEFPKSSLYVIDGKPGITTSFEFTNNASVVNIMLSDLGDNENFGPEKLGPKEREESLNQARMHTKMAKDCALCDGPPHYYKHAYEKAEKLSKEIQEAAIL